MKRNRIDRRLQLQIVFAFTAIFAGLLFVTRPPPTTGQLVFRLAVAAAGLAGFLVVTHRR